MAQQEANAAMVLELLDRVLKSWWTVVAGLCFGLGGSFVAMKYMPKVYEASTKIWVSQQQIPEDVVATTVTDDWSLRMVAFREALLDQPYMIELIERTFGIPEDEEELRKLIRKLRKQLVVDPRSERRSVNAFYVTYRDDDPQRAAKVVNTLTELYVNQNEEFRTSQAEITAKTIEEMAEKAKQEFDVVDRRLNEFNQKHPSETEAHLSANINMRESKQRELELNLRGQRTLDEQLRSLDNLLTEAKQNAGHAALEVDTNTVTVVDPVSQRIAALQRELKELRSSYSELHPSIRKKKRELEDLLAIARSRRASEPGQAPGVEPKPYVDATVAALQSQIFEVERQKAQLLAEETELRKEIHKFERRIDVVPEVQQQLNAILEEREVLLERFRKLQRDAEQAKGSVDLERGDQGERMEVLEWAWVPNAPVSPSPLKIYALGLVAGVLLFVGPLVLGFVLNPAVNSEAGLVSFSEIPVLVSLPTLETARTQGAGRRRLLKNLGLSLASSAVLAASAVLVFLM